MITPFTETFAEILTVLKSGLHAKGAGKGLNLRWKGITD